MPEFTHAQKQAVESRNGTILVSAAAGSGKTTVLVERVIQRLADKENPCPADSLLIVTFTKAATAQMKEKIAAALEKRLDENPSDEHLLKQRMLLPFAKISTIDSFCGEIVRENFQALGISPDFKMLEENELAVMRGDAVSSVLQNAYSQNDEGFKRLLEMFVSGSDDKAFSGLILSIYKNSRAFPFPEKWLDSLVEPYSENKDVMSTVWGAFLKKYLTSVADYCISILTQALELFEKNDSTVYECCSSAFSSFIKIFESFRECVNNDSWNKIIHSLDSYDSGLRIGYPRGYRSFFLDMAKALKSEISDIVNKKIKEKIFCCTQDEFIEDNEYVLPAVKKLITLVKEFGREFSALKSASDGADFSDVVENALKLLIKGVDENGNPIKTELAENLCSRYSEILVDEFQDINETQNMLFKAISKNESNLFMVGDVKQSIYNFRQANPEIFLNRRKALDYFEGNNYPAKINLDYNFRSRKGVTDFVNFVFSQLMSEDLGGLKYDDSETLKPKATYPETDQPGAEVHFVCMDDGLRIEREGEAQYIADYIRKQIEEGLTVTDGDTQRPASYRDFCILLRNANNRADIYADVLNKNSIPCYVASKTGFFDAVEIKTAISLMEVVDNPVRDIPLASVLISPIFGFTPDELAVLRCSSPEEKSYYACVKNAAHNGKKKCIDFLNTVKRLRALSVTLGAGEFVREMLLSTGYDCIVSAMPGGDARKANLAMLLEYAEKYEQSGHTGLSGFLRFIDKVRRQNGDFEIANSISESADTVKIMTIHKSKGLEFPVCILADCSSKFNIDNSGIAFDPKYGVAFKRRQGYNSFETLAFRAVRTAHEIAERSEEMRVLYVALTRAKEKIVCVIRDDNPEKSISKILLSPERNTSIHPIRLLSCSKMADWLMLACMRHFDFSVLPCVSQVSGRKIVPSESDVLFTIGETALNYESEEKDKKLMPEPDSDLLSELKSRLEYRYPYSDLLSLTAKVSPSMLENHGDILAHFASSEPDFVRKGALSGASRGTAVHKFMEFCDFTGETGSIKSQALQMVKENKLSEAEEKVLDYNVLERFFKSDIAARIRKSDRLEREKRVTFTVPARDIYPVDSDEEILVQGYIDCAFEENGKWVVVDYKTDNVSQVSELCERYSAQLKMYERALKECTGIEVSETVIYSLKLTETISI